MPAVIGILAALMERHRTGKGQMVDVSMHEGTMALMSFPFAKILGGESELRTELLGSVPCYRVYRTADDRHVTLSALEPKFWKEFCQAVERPDLLPRQFATGDASAIPELERIFAAHPLDHWVELGRRHDVCLEPVLRLDEALRHPSTRERGFLRWGRHPIEGEIPHLGQGFRLSNHPSPPIRTAPRLGDDEASVLGEVGYDGAALAELDRLGVTRPRSRLKRFTTRVLHAARWCVGDSMVRALLTRRPPNKLNLRD